MGIIATIVIGFVVGLVARFLLPGRDSMGFLMTTVIGIGGALLASFAMQTMGYAEPGRPAGMVASIVGAIVLLLIYRRVRANQP